MQGREDIEQENERKCNGRREGIKRAERWRGICLCQNSHRDWPTVYVLKILNTFFFLSSIKCWLSGLIFTKCLSE